MPVYPHAGCYPPDDWPNQYNRITPGAVVGIYTDQATTTLATLYADRDRAAPAANPITLDSNGNNPTFFAEPDTYWAARITDGDPGTPVKIAVKVDDEDAIDLPSGTEADYLGTVADQAAMLALAPASIGDWAIRSDTSTEWRIVTGDGSLIGDWVETPYPVVSVNGRNGAVVGLTEDTDPALTDERVPLNASVGFNKLTADVLAVLTSASGGYLAAQELGAAVSALDGEVAVVTDLSVATLDVDVDVVVLVTGQVANADAGVTSVVSVKVDGVEVDSIAPRSPWNAESIPFAIRSLVRGPVDAGVPGHLLVGGTGYAWTPNQAAFHGSIVRGRMLVAPDVWANGEVSPFDFQTLFAQWETSGAQRAVLVRLNGTGAIRTTLTENGTTLFSVDSGPFPGTVDGEPLWVGWERNAATAVTTISRSEDGITWAPIASTVLGTPGNPLFASTAVWSLGAFDGIPPSGAGSAPLTGKIYAFELAVDGVVVANPDFRTAVAGASLTDLQGNVWKFVP